MKIKVKIEIGYVVIALCVFALSRYCVMRFCVVALFSLLLRFR